MLTLHTWIKWKKILSVVDKIALFKDLKIKDNMQDGFDGKVAEPIKLIDLIGSV